MTEILIPDFVKGLLIFLRIVGFIMVVPLFSNSNVPNFVKLVLALAFTYIIYFMTGDYKFDFNTHLITLALDGFKEVLSGVLMGFMVLMIFEGISFAGLMIGFDMGLSIAEAFDIATESSSNVIGLVLNLMAMMIFILIDGHHYLLRAVAYSFKIIPLGHYSINEGVILTLIKYSSYIFVLGLKISAPIVVSFFLVHLASGIIARVSPQLNIFFIIQPLKLGMGFVMLIILVPIYVYLIRDLLQAYENSLLEFVKQMAG